MFIAHKDYSFSESIYITSLQVVLTVKRRPVFHYNSVYTFWPFVITYPIPRRLNIYMKVTDEDKLVETT